MYTPVKGSEKKGLSRGILVLELVPRAELPVDGHYLAPSTRLAQTAIDPRPLETYTFRQPAGEELHWCLDIWCLDISSLDISSLEIGPTHAIAQLKERPEFNIQVSHFYIISVFTLYIFYIR